MVEKKTEELILEARNFFEAHKKEIGKSVKEGKNIIYIGFEEITSFSPIISEMLITHPEEILQVLEVALEETGLVTNPRVRLLSLPEQYSEKIRNLRAKHLNKMMQIEGIVRQASEVRPQVINAKFECPSCGTIISVLQIESRFREPTRCSCGRKGGFKLVTKDMVDAQRIVIEESPESLVGGEQPRRISIFLKEDLVEPKMEDKTTPGSRVRVIGILKEIPRLSQTGGILTRYDIALEANNIISLEETFEELDISEEEERQIKELAADERVFEKFMESIAPSVFGYEEIKKSLVLQLFGGIKKIRSDNTQSRGDIHVLLVGDPGVAKSIGRNEKILYFSNNEHGYETIEKIFEKFSRYPKNLNVLTINQQKHNVEWCHVKEIIKHLPEKSLIKIKTEHGKEIIATKDHSFITLSESGEIIPISGDKLTQNSYLPIPTNFHKQIIDAIETANYNTNKTNARQLPNKIKLNNDFGFFVGIFLSEGNIRGGKDVLISSNNTEIKGKINKFIKKLGLNPRIEKKAISIPSKSLANFLNFYCYKKDSNWKNTKIKGCYSRIKKIPDFSYFSNEEFIKGLLSGVFSGDGRYIKDKIKARGIELITVSKELAHGTSDLLFSIGILNRIIKRQYIYKNNKTNYFTIQIPNYMLRLFFKKINFLREKLVFSAPIYSYHDLIPCGNLIYNLVKKLGFNRRINGNRTLAAEMRTVKKRNKIGRIRLLKILDNLPKRAKHMEEFKVLKKIAQSPLVWSKIVKIEKIKGKKENVYDLYIPKTNTFVANGIGVHNSVMLKFISGIAPKGRYVAGKGTTSAGLTATVVRDEFLRGWSLEAGAMVLANKGLVAIDEIEKMDPQDRSAMHEAMEQQCYLPNLEITFTDNSKEKIGQFIDKLMDKNKSVIKKGNNCEILKLNKNIKILTTDFESIYPTTINRVSRHLAPKKFVKINLVNGRKVTVTPEHPCWTVKDGKITTIPAINLKTGNFFPIPAELPIEGEEQDLNPYKNGPALCKLLGYHITDGCYELNRGIKNGIQFCNNDKKLIDDYINSIKEVFDINPVITKRKNQFSVRVISKQVVEFIKNLDKNLLEKGKFKKIPDKIIKCKREDIVFLLRAIFDGDGTVVNVKRNGCRVSLVTENIELAEQVSELLLRFAILSSIYKDKEFFRVDICGQENLLKFFNYIGFLSKKKHDRLKIYFKKQKTYRSISDIVPNTTETIKRIFKHLKINVERDLGNQICMNCNKHRLFLQKMVNTAEEKIDRLLKEKKVLENTTNSLELRRIRKKLEFSALNISKKLEISSYMLEQYEKKEINNKPYQKLLLIEIEKMLSILPELREIKKLAFGKIRWSRIKSVEVIKNENIKWVYDITVEPTHSFISNNMILHNSVTISKANVQASLRAETSVLAAANPKFGRFDPYQTVASQIDMPPTLINRFDVIFILKDNPDRARDEAIATHVLLEHQQLAEKTFIDRELFKKYIAYSKQKIFPKLTDEAVDEIKKFYVDLRNTPVSIEQPTKPLPISARQLEALVRLSEAAARLRLSKKVTKQDAKIAIDLMKFYLMQVGYDYETKTYDIDRIATGVSTSQRGKIILVRENLIRLESRLGKLIPIEEIKKELGGKIEEKDIDDALDKLTISGDIFHPRKGFVQRM